MMFRKIKKLKNQKNIKKFNKVKVITAVLLITTLGSPLNMIEALENKGGVLIIYDEYKEYASDFNNLNCIIKMSLTTGKPIKLKKINNYTNEDLDNAEGIIVLSNREGSFTKAQVDELYLNNEKLLWIGKNSSKNDVITLGFKSEEYMLKIKKNIYDKFVKESDRKQNCYLVLDEVYPYDDLNSIIEKAEYLYNLGIPFIVTSMEVFKNLEFDSMKRYTETLRYCVSKGGTIILGDPYLYNKGPTEDELIKNIGIAQDAFINYKVYPIGLTINDYYLYRNDRVKYLENASTIIINENKNLGVIDFENFSIKAFSNVLIKINGGKLDFLNKDSAKLLTNVAIGVKGSECINDFKENVDGYIKKGIEFSDPKYLESELTFGVNKINNTKNGVMINGVNVKNNIFLSNEQLYANEEEIKIEEKSSDEGINLKQGNKVIFLIAISGGIVFIIFFLYSLKIDKKKYFK